MLIIHKEGSPWSHSLPLPVTLSPGEKDELAGQSLMKLVSGCLSSVDLLFQTRVYHGGCCSSYHCLPHMSLVVFHYIKLAFKCRLNGNIRSHPSQISGPARLGPVKPPYPVTAHLLRAHRYSQVESYTLGRGNSFGFCLDSPGL